MKKSYLLILLCFLFLCGEVYGQKKSVKSDKGKTSKSSKKSGDSDNSGGKKFGVGLRLGDPLGLTMKGYFGKMALEFNLGRSFMWGYGYDRYYKYDYRRNPYYDPYYNPNYYDPRNPYSNYYKPRILSMQLHLLRQKPISSVKGLDFYFGGGLQFRYFRYYYRFYDRYNRWYEQQYGQTGLGVDVVGGLEYTLTGAPITFFGDLNLYLEFYEVPMWLALQGGLGIRFNF